MSGNRVVLGAFVFLFLTAVLFGQVPPQVPPIDSMFGATSGLGTLVTVVPLDPAACSAVPMQQCVMRATVLAFTSPVSSTSALQERSQMQQVAATCASDSDPSACLINLGLGTAAGQSGSMVSVQGAQVTFSYLNTLSGTWNTISGCYQLPANTAVESAIPQSNPPQDMVYYYADCPISPTDTIRTGSPTTQIQVTYLGTQQVSGQPTLPAPAQQYTLSNPSPSTAAALSTNVNLLLAGVTTATTGGGPAVCVGVFLILGLLLASLYFSGKSPVTLLDITTPKLPAPKGVAAGGQVLLPYGWSELKGTTAKKMNSASNALGKSMAFMPGTGAAQGLMPVKEAFKGERTVASAINALGQKTNVSADKLSQLARKLPYQYGDAEHKIVAEIFDKAAKLGGRESLMAAQAKDYMMGLRTTQTLDAITGHTNIGVKSPLMKSVDKVLSTSGLTANRYAVLGGGITAGAASTVRTFQMIYRGGKKAVKEAPVLGAAVAGTTMAALSGRSVDELARTSSTARWLSRMSASDSKAVNEAWQKRQTTLHPNAAIPGVIGTYYPTTGKMSALYATLYEETLHDEMRYVLRELYKKAGMNFNMGEAEFVEMGYKDMDILKRCGYTASAQMEALDERVRSILTKTGAALSSITIEHENAGQARFDILHGALKELTTLADSRGVHLDSQLRAMNDNLKDIAMKSEPDHLKLGMVQMALEKQHNLFKGADMERVEASNAYVCHVGGDSLKGSQVFETMALRTMIWDAEHGFLHGGIKQELTSTRLNVVNRVTGLDASSEHAMAQLPEYMRNKAELEKLAARNKADMISLFSEEGKSQFQKATGKTMSSASIADIVGFTQGGGALQKSKEMTKNGKMVWWGEDKEHGISPDATLVDVKRHWITELNERENFALGQWVESRFTRSYVPYFDAGVEAQLNRMPGSTSWTVAQRTEEAKKLVLTKLLNQDMENRYNSQFAQNAYGTTHETMRFYEGQMAGLLKKVMTDPVAQGGRGMDPNDPELRALEHLDFNDPSRIKEFNDILNKYHKEVDALLKKPITYDDVAKSRQAVVMLHEGGLAYYHKGMMLSDMDRVLGGEVALKDGKGQLRKYNPDDVAINFGGNQALMQAFGSVRNSKRTEDWKGVLNAAKDWANEGSRYDYERQKVFGAVLWQYANVTHDYGKFWEQSAVSVEAKRQVTPLAPSVMRFFGAEAPALTTMLKPWRDIGLHFGDYISKVSLAAGGPVHKAVYDIAPISDYYRQHSFQLSSKILSGQALKGLSEDERVAYRAAAVDHFAYHQVWDYAIDRSPARQSTSFGVHQGWGSFFQFGPAQVFDVRSNLGASMSKGQYANFMAFYGFPMDLAGKILRPYTSMIRGMQMSMQGYASKWDATGDVLRQWNNTSPRLQEAMQSVNPFSFKWFPGKTSERLQKLNVYGGSLERHQLAGADFMAGLRQAPQDIYLNRKGVYATARTGEANPGLSHYNYRHELTPEASAAEYLFRMNEGAFMYDARVKEAAMTNTVRRTVGAEALAIRRSQELRSFGIMQNPLYGFFSPLGALWHAPIPGTPSFLTPKDWVSKYVRKSKEGAGPSISFSDRVQSVADGIGKNLTKFVQPGQLSRVVYCPLCGTPNYRGSYCKRCHQTQY
jgi:hypothetical protein